MAVCPAENTVAKESQASFWTGHWDNHQKGWVIAGSCATVAVIIVLVNLTLHWKHYYNPRQQRQVTRILLLPLIFAILSWSGYRWFRAFVYFQAIRDVWEAIALAAFMALMIYILGHSERDQLQVLQAKDKKKLPFPFGFWRYRPSKPYFLVTIKWSVLQFCIVKPLLALATIITEAYGVYCATLTSYEFASIYIATIDFVSVSIALYGLLVFYALCKDELQGKHILWKFISLKLVIFFTYYQEYVLDILEHYNVIHATTYWTEYNIASGINALAICAEMILIAALQLWCFNYTEYKPVMADSATKKMGFWRASVDWLDFRDFAIDLWGFTVFIFDRLRGKSYTTSKTQEMKEMGGEGRFDIHDAWMSNTVEGKQDTRLL